MPTRLLLTVLAILGCTAHAIAQTPWQFRWQPGLTLTYKVKHATNVAETVNGKTNEARSQLDLVKRWHVTDVDAKGIATLEMTLIAMRNEQKRSGGEPLLYDSQDLAKSTPELREQMSKFIGKPIAILRMDKYGRVHQAKLGSAKRYEAEPPFAIVFPDAMAAAGQTWRRPFTLVMEPPQGTGEKYQAEQVYHCKQLENNKALLTIRTEFKSMPDNASDRLPLLQKELQGELVFDLQKGRPASIQLNIDRTIENHQGKGSSYRFRSQYVETLVE